MCIVAPRPRVGEPVGSFPRSFFLRTVSLLESIHCGAIGPLPVPTLRPSLAGSRSLSPHSEEIGIVAGGPPSTLSERPPGRVCSVAARNVAPGERERDG